MAAKHSPDRHEDFLRAILCELNRVIEDDPTGWTVAKRLPAVVQASQLSVYGLLVLKGTDRAHAAVYPHKAKLEALFDKALQKSKSVWAEALTKKPSSRQRYLEDLDLIRPAVRAVVKYADKSFGLHGERLGGFGVDNVQDSLAGLVGKFSALIEVKLNSGKAGVVPGAVRASIGLGMLAGGLAGRHEISPKEVSVARVLARMGEEKDERGGPEPKPVKRLRKALKGLAAHLPEQRG